MPGNPHPAATWTGDKSATEALAYAKLHERVVVADASEVRNTDFTGQFGGVWIRSLRTAFDFDNTSTDPDDGTTTIIDAAGNPFVRQDIGDAVELTLIDTAGTYTLADDGRGYRIIAISGNVTINVGVCADRNGKPFTIALDGYDPTAHTLAVNFQTGEGPRGSDTWGADAGPYEVETFNPTEDSDHFWIG